MEALSAVDKALAGKHLLEICRQVLEFEFSIESNVSYVNQFGLNDWL